VTETIKDGEDWQARVQKIAEAPTMSDDIARAHEPNRGRNANSPTDIPFQGWKDIGARVLLSIPQNRLLTLSGGVAFFAILSIFPGIAAMVSLYGLFADIGTIVDHLRLLNGVLPPDILELIRGQILGVVAKSNGTLSLAVASALLISLWSANSGVSAFFDALNVVYGEKEKRSILVVYATTLAATLGTIALVIVSVFAIVILPLLVTAFGFDTTADKALQYLRWPVLLVVITVVLSIGYRIGPSRHDPKWRWVTPGSVAAALVWVAVSMAFSWYVAEFNSYNRLYGSLGAIVAFMTWFWISIFVSLLGAAVDAETEHQTARDSTLGPPKPLGARGATMADHVGKSVEELGF
jgi:membrane protein